MQLKRILGSMAVGLTVAGLSAAAALGGETVVDGPMKFTPIAGSAYGQASTTWTEPFVVPGGFAQTLVKDETTFDIYGGGVDDLTEMNTSTRPVVTPVGTCTARTRSARTARYRWST